MENEGIYFIIINTTIDKYEKGENTLFMLYMSSMFAIIFEHPLQIQMYLC